MTVCVCVGVAVHLQTHDMKTRQEPRDAGGRENGMVMDGVRKKVQASLTDFHRTVHPLLLHEKEKRERDCDEIMKGCC